MYLNRLSFGSVWDFLPLLSWSRLRDCSIGRFARGFLGLDCVEDYLFLLFTHHEASLCISRVWEGGGERGRK